MATSFTATELDLWCVCGRPHQSYCRDEPCYWGLHWPYPHMELQSMEDTPWLNAAQAERQAIYAEQQSAAHMKR